MEPLMADNKELESFSTNYSWAKVKYNLVKVTVNGKKIIICNVHTFWTMSIDIHNQLFVDFKEYLLKYLKKYKLDIQDVVIIGDFNRADALQIETSDNTSPNNDLLITKLFDITENTELHIYPYNHTGNDFIFTGENIDIKRNDGDVEPQPWFGSFSLRKDLYYTMPLVNGFKDIVARFIQAHFNTPRPVNTNGEDGFEQNVNFFKSHFKGSLYEDLVSNIIFKNCEDIFKKKIKTITLKDGKETPVESEFNGAMYKITLNETHKQMGNNIYILDFGKAFPGSGLDIYDYLIDLLQKRNFELWKEGKIISDHLPICANLVF